MGLPIVFEVIIVVGAFMAFGIPLLGVALNILLTLGTVMVMLIANVVGLVWTVLDKTQHRH